MTLNKIKNSIIVIFIILISITLVLSCKTDPVSGDSGDAGDNGTQSDIDILGTWVENPGSYYSKLVITNTRIENYNEETATDTLWDADIESYYNDEWNADETGEGEYGYMVIYYTKASSWVPQSLNKYNILRWKNITDDNGTVTMEYSEAYCTDGGTTAIYFDTPEDAKAQATEENGCFSIYSTTEKNN